MDGNHTTVLLLCDDAALRARVAAALAVAGLAIVDTLADVQLAAVPAVVVLAHEEAVDRSAKLRALCPASASAHLRAAPTYTGEWEIASEQCDIVLPAEVTDDELRRAVHVLAKLAALRGELLRAKLSQGHWARLAETDSLTELPNRRAWDEALAVAVREAYERRRPLCVAVLDLDEFKGVNDADGHAAGDAVLKAVAEGLRSAVRKGDFAARLGGDEFGLLLPELTADSAPAVLERIRGAALRVLAKRGLPRATCSVGFTANVPAATAVEPVFGAADEALRRAKQAGRDRIGSL